MGSLIQTILDERPLADRDYFHSQDYNGIIMVWHFDDEAKSAAVTEAMELNSEYLISIGKDGFRLKIRIEDIKPVELVVKDGLRNYEHRFWMEYIRDGDG